MVKTTHFCIIDAMDIVGKIGKIIFRNPENGYTVFLLVGEKDDYVIVGTTPPFSEGDHIECTVEPKNNAKYGLQYQLINYQIRKPEDKKEIEKYLASGLFKGIGPALALRIVNKFGEATLDVIEKNHNFLTKIKGISPRIAKSLNEQYMQYKDQQEYFRYLQSIGLSLNLSTKIIAKYGSATNFKIKSNPYSLIRDIPGVGFLTADRIALNMGYELNSPFRIQAGIEYALDQSSAIYGHTYATRKELYSAARYYLSNENFILDYDLFEDILDRLIANGRVKCISLEKDDAIMLPYYYQLEDKIAEKILRLSQNHKKIGSNIHNSIKYYETLNKISLHGDQKEAIIKSIQEGVSIITGGPGTGKTTIVKCISGIFKSLGREFALCAPTGRAAKRLEESTSLDAKTIHRLLEVNVINDSYSFVYNQDNRLPFDVVIVDEISMCDEQIFFSLISALRDDATLILIGDKDQLPSVGAGSVLSNLIESDVVCVSYLTYVYRQDEHSLISYNAHLINNSRMIEYQNDKDDDFLFYDIENIENIFEKTISLASSEIAKSGKFMIDDIQVLAQMRKGFCGVNKLNEMLQHVINPPNAKKAEIKLNEVVFREGDRVMHTANNYLLEWVKYDDKGAVVDIGTGVFNGEIGRISKIGPSNDLKVVFDDNKLVHYQHTNLQELTLSYAISVHKSQGSEFPVVIIPLVNGPSMLANKKIIYTGLTRGKKLAIFVGSKNTLRKMISNSYTIKRNTLLVEKLHEKLNNYSQ